MILSGVTGISLPIITFSLSPKSLSTLPLKEASVKISVVCSNEAAESQLSVCKALLVTPETIFGLECLVSKMSTIQSVTEAQVNNFVAEKYKIQ